MLNRDKIVSELKVYGILEKNHTDKSLIEHLIGTYEILKGWNCEDYLCAAGLCHSLYGTESYKSQSVPLERRGEISKLIGNSAEELTYLFGAHTKDHFWSLLKKEDDFEILDRFTNEKIKVSKETISNLVTLTLANWLEQRPRAGEKYQFLRKQEFLQSERFLPTAAYTEFKKQYNIH